MNSRPRKLAISHKDALNALRKVDSSLGPYEMIIEIRDAFFPMADHSDNIKSYNLGLRSTVRHHINFLESLGFTYCMLVSAVKKDVAYGVWEAKDPEACLGIFRACDCRYCTDSENKNAPSS